ncbi:hypothetical protein EON65_30650 [archaeon]|nr:MAG: hypothetical protein EON65_30650 [archaeon]
MTNYHKYNLWKWRELSNRRLLYVSLFQILLVFMWMSVSFLLKKTPAEDPDSATHLFYPIPMVLAIFHGTSWLFIAFTEKGKKFLREAQGKYVCYWTICSFLLNETLHVVIYNNTLTHDAALQAGVVFSVTSLVGAQTVSHWGTAEGIVHMTKAALAVPWICFLAIMVGAELILCCISLIINMAWNTYIHI